ncbi:ABC transporter ATP-binding protein [Marinivivus vitaminiproducens]|uniref:ABC transporter ATP-binding protein n=1 Tax=Marinivivus vitaminiproducens TaxID=3035935 RepID=UPI00279C8F3B|nr:ABC transporter ATP-binding protein [Geminicoccaceae bacterium SCSIO 64248]
MSRTGETIARFDHVTKAFDKAVAVDDLNLDIGVGDFVTLLGPSGCGKTTTLRILGGFEVPTKGRVLLDGVDVTRQPPNRRHVNMVFQDYALFPHMTVGENIAFGLELKGSTRSEIDIRTRELLDFLQLGNMRERMPDQLSGGQRQRVALARALAPDPKLLLLDEPLGALDAKLRAQVQVELKEIQRRTGKTFVFVTHDQDEALTMSDRIIVMNHGKIEQDGTPEDLYSRPRSRFVAEFIGETNLIAGTVRSTDATSVVIDWQGVPIRGASPEHRLAEGADVTASLRPECVSCHAEPPVTEGAIEGRIVRRLFKGSRTSVDVRLAHETGPTLKAYLHPRHVGSAEDQRIWVTWQPDHLAVLQD